MASNPNPGWIWSEPHNDYYRTQWVPNASQPAGGAYECVFYRTEIAVSNRPRHIPDPRSNEPRAGGSERTVQGYGAGSSAHYAQPTSGVGNMTDRMVSLDVDSYVESSTSSNPNGNGNTTQSVLYAPQQNSMTQSYRETQQAQRQQQYQPQGQQFGVQSSGYGGAYIAGTASSGYQGAGDQPIRANSLGLPLSLPSGGSDAAVTDEQGSLIRGTPELAFEPLDPSYRLVGNEWAFFVRGRVFQMLLIENASEMIPMGSANVSLVRYGGRAFVRISRFVVVEAKANRHYSKCIPISTYSGRATTGKSNGEQREHGIIYSGDRPPQRFEQEAYLHKDAIKVDIIDPSLKLSADSRINYAFTRPIQHNVKVKNVGKIAQNDMYKLFSYWREYR